MNLVQQPDEGNLPLRWVRADAIGVGDQTLQHSFLLAVDQLMADWPPRAVDELDQAALAPILALQPEVLLLGTGQRQRFPAPALLASLLQRGIGVEVMDNAAAARTYSLLAQEGRRVVAAFLLPG
ncbi:MAG: Mth938-like domain-containing protein [Lysobacteraceae bacterium]